MFISIFKRAPDRRFRINHVHMLEDTSIRLNDLRKRGKNCLVEIMF